MQVGESRVMTPIAALAALGVVFGDIGTSPLYALGSAFSDTGDTDPIIVNGVTSMVIWAVALIVSVLYVRILMRYDNEGEGGLLALLALLRRKKPSKRLAVLATGLAILGAAMFLGDSMITPAISVLSALEGLSVSAPALSGLIVPVTVVVLAALFLVQRFGTSRIGATFGPIMLVWFLCSAAFGTTSLIQTPTAAFALSPHWILLLVVAHPWTAFVALGSVVLAITGAEALFADMGHFGRTPITAAWLVVVFPALVLTYLGQAAGVLRSVSAGANPFFSMIPQWAGVPMVILAAVATVIASQSVISGAFSVVQQASRLGLLPRLRTVFTSASNRGQIFLPFVNTLLAIAVIALVLGFRSSAALAAAYGVAVTLTISITTTLLLLFLAMRKKLLSAEGLITCALLALVILFFAANTMKIPTGGWLPLVVGAVLSTIMWAWSRGTVRVESSRRADKEPLAKLLTRIKATARTPGTTVYITRHAELAPSALTATLELFGVLTDRVLVVAVQTVNRPFGVKARVTQIGAGVSVVDLRFGYMQAPHVVDALGQPFVVAETGLTAEQLATATYVVSSNTPVTGAFSPLPAWQRHLYLALNRAVPPSESNFKLPAEQTITIGRELAI